MKFEPPPCFFWSPLQHHLYTMTVQVKKVIFSVTAVRVARSRQQLPVCFSHFFPTFLIYPMFLPFLLHRTRPRMSTVAPTTFYVIVLLRNVLKFPRDNDWKVLTVPRWTCIRDSRKKSFHAYHIALTFKAFI